MTLSTPLSASVTVAYNPGTSTYTTNGEATFGKIPFPTPGSSDGITDFEYDDAWAYNYPAPLFSQASGWWTHNGNKVSGWVPRYDYYNPLTFSWNDISSDGGGQLSLTGNVSGGTFAGTASAIPEPSSIAMIAIGLSCVSAFRAFSRMNRP